MAQLLFGKYELLKKVGTGGMAELFLARQPGIEGFEKLIVIKRILPHLVDSKQFIQMFLDEARLAARLNHPNIVQIYDLGRVQNQYFIAMEYINGVDLAKILKRERKLKRFVPVQHAVKIMSYVCEGLTYAHDRKDTRGQPLNIVHRDVSPHNVLIAFDGGVKITDFGIAKASTTAAHTKSGTLKGKYYYMSPEQCLGRPVDQRSDIFSAGILLYQLLTSTLPFRGDSDFSVLHSIVHDAPRPPSAVRPDFPVSLYPVLDRALAKDPGDRFQNALEMQMALEKCLVEAKAVSNTTLIGQYLQTLFADVFEAQSRLTPEDTANIDEFLAGLAIAQGTPSAETTPGIAIKTPSFVGEIDDDDDIPILTPSMIEAEPGTVRHRPGATPARLPAEPAPVPRRSRMRVPLLLAAVFLSAICGALLVHYLGQMESEEEPRPGDATPATAPDAGPAEPSVATHAAATGGDPGPADAGPVASPAADPGPTTAHRPGKKRRKLRTRKKRQVAVNPPKPAGEGYLTLDTQPWTEVWLGGKRLGLTPLAYHKLPAGRHKLLLRNREKKIQKTLWIEIQPDQTVTRNLNLEK